MVQFETTQTQSLGRPQEGVWCEWSRRSILSTGLQRSKLIFSISRLLATFIFKMVANGKFRSPKIVVSLTQDTSYYLHEGATAERCVRK